MYSIRSCTRCDVGAVVYTDCTDYGRSVSKPSESLSSKRRTRIGWTRIWHSTWTGKTPAPAGCPRSTRTVDGWATWLARASGSSATAGEVAWTQLTWLPEPSSLSPGLTAAFAAAAVVAALVAAVDAVRKCNPLLSGPRYCFLDGDRHHRRKRGCYWHGRDRSCGCAWPRSHWWHGNSSWHQNRRHRRSCVDPFERSSAE